MSSKPGCALGHALPASSLCWILVGFLGYGNKVVVLLPFAPAASFVLASQELSKIAAVVSAVCLLRRAMGCTCYEANGVT